MKKKILILGNSSFFQRRVLPSLKKIKKLKIFICSKSNKIDKNKNIYFNDYDLALKKNKFDLIYISLINPLHYKFAKKALMMGNKIVIDKPITLEFAQTKELIKIAKQKKVLLSEFTIFNHHLIFQKIKKMIGGFKNIELIRSNFNIPKATNLKKYKTKQNDCLEDMSPYASSLIRIFLNGKVENFLVKKNYFKNQSKIVKEFTLFAYNKKTHLIGNFGIDKEYESKIVFYGKNKIIEVPYQAFALPTNKKISIKLKEKNKNTKFYLIDDYIKRSFEKFLFAKNSNNYYLNKINIDNNIKKKLGLFK